MIVLTQEQANSVEGCGLNGSELRPLFYNGQYLLPEAVLLDNDYIEQREFLSRLPVANIEVVVNDE